MASETKEKNEGSASRDRRKRTESQSRIGKTGTGKKMAIGEDLGTIQKVLNRERAQKTNVKVFAYKRGFTKGVVWGEDETATCEMRAPKRNYNEGAA